MELVDAMELNGAVEDAGPMEATKAAGSVKSSRANGAVKTGKS